MKTSLTGERGGGRGEKRKGEGEKGWRGRRRRGEGREGRGKRKGREGGEKDEVGEVRVCNNSNSTFLHAVLQ